MTTHAVQLLDDLLLLQFGFLHMILEERKSLSTIANSMTLPMNLRMLDTDLDIAVAEEKEYSFSDEYFKNIGFMNLY
nr:unnamed protein product [Callosobruchus chinensis]